MSSMVLLTGKKANAPLLRYLGKTLELKFRHAAYNAKDKQHVGYALEVSKDVGRIVVAMDKDDGLLDPPARVVLADLRLSDRICTGLTDGYFRSDLPLCDMVHRLAVSHLLLLHCRNQLGQ